MTDYIKEYQKIFDEFGITPIRKEYVSPEYFANRIKKASILEETSITYSYHTAVYNTETVDTKAILQNQ